MELGDKTQNVQALGPPVGITSQMKYWYYVRSVPCVHSLANPPYSLSVSVKIYKR